MRQTSLWLRGIGTDQLVTAIAERGDHKTLLAQKGLYYDLWQKQIRAENEAVIDVKQAAQIETPPSEPIAHHEHP